MKLASVTVLIASLLPFTAAVADDPLADIPMSISTSVIDGNALSGARGRNAVNIAAGDANAQINAAAIALNPNGVASAGVMTQQNFHLNDSQTPGLAVSGIGGHAFNNTVGALSVNQTSGSGNIQANGVVIGIGLDVNVLSESMLSNTTTGAGLAARDVDGATHSATISDSAFTGSRGLVQVNQSAGSGNSTANNFVLQLDLGTK